MIVPNCHECVNVLHISMSTQVSAVPNQKIYAVYSSFPCIKYTLINHFIETRPPGSPALKERPIIISIRSSSEEHRSDAPAAFAPSLARPAPQITGSAGGGGEDPPAPRAADRRSEVSPSPLLLRAAATVAAIQRQYNS